MSERQHCAANGVLESLVDRILAAVILAASVGFVADPVEAQTDVRDAVKLARSGQWQAATDQAVKDVEDRPYSERNWRFLIDLQVEQGLYEAARVSLDNALKRFPSSIILRWKAIPLLKYTGEQEQADAFLEDIGTLARRTPWRYSDPASRIVLGRYFLSQGADARQVLNVFFDPIKKSNPSYVETYLASGELALQKHDYSIAAAEFEKAVKLEPDNPDAFFGLARASQKGAPERAESAFARLQQLNPRHVDFLLHQIEQSIDAERYEAARELLAEVFKIHPAHPRAWAFESVLAILRNDPTSAAAARDTALARWSTNPAVDYWIGKKLSDKYRFAEGAAYQRSALEMDEDYPPARFQLAQDLLRLGDEAAGWELAESVATRDAYNVVAHNLLVLKDRIDAFTTIETPQFILRMDEREAEIYGAAVIRLLTRAHEELTSKYAVQLDGPVVVELFPEQPDFAIRTFGLPGGAGFLGVCFGQVITANSPASQRDTPANWESVLWHEFCHVVTLNKTRNRMPRWLSEGISVYEELQQDPAWGQSMNSTYRQMILGGELTPVSQLSAAFLRPDSALHLQFAYFESNLVVEFLVKRFGEEALRKILDDLGKGLEINQVLSRHTIPIEELDREFAKYARQLAQEFASAADWTQPESEEADPALWLRANPNSVWALRSLLKSAAAQQDWSAVEQYASQLDQLVPGQTGESSPLSLLALSFRERNQTAQERDALVRLTANSADQLAALERLMDIGQTTEDWNLVLNSARQIQSINPLLPSVHQARRKAAIAVEADDDLQSAILCLLALNPLDPAGLHFELAQSFARTGRTREARRHVLQALEIAPRYRDALRLLVELPRASPTRDSATATPDALPAPRNPNSRPAPPPLPENSPPQPNRARPEPPPLPTADWHSFPADTINPATIALQERTR